MQHKRIDLEFEIKQEIAKNFLEQKITELEQSNDQKIQIILYLLKKTAGNALEIIEDPGWTLGDTFYLLKYGEKVFNGKIARWKKPLIMDNHKDVIIITEEKINEISRGWNEYVKQNLHINEERLKKEVQKGQEEVADNFRRRHSDIKNYIKELEEKKEEIQKSIVKEEERLIDQKPSMIKSRFGELIEFFKDQKSYNDLPYNLYMATEFLEDIDIKDEENNVCSPFVLKFFNQNFNSSTSRSSFSVDENTGDVVLLPDSNGGYFENIELSDFDPVYKTEEYTIHERHSNGDLEIYKITLGKMDQYGTKYIEIQCSETGNLYRQDYGQRRISDIRKPVIAFRNFNKNTEFEIEVEIKNGNFDVIYPTPQIKNKKNITWKGNTFDKKSIKIDGKKYPYLFWDARVKNKNFSIETGNIISSENTMAFLENACSKFSFDADLTTDFVTFWRPYLQQHRYNIVSFLINEECSCIANMKIKTPLKTQVVRVYMMYKPLINKIDFPIQNLSTIKKSSEPTIFEWGGFEF